MGFGCTDNQSVLQCVEEKMTWDTSTYINKELHGHRKGIVQAYLHLNIGPIQGIKILPMPSISMTHIESGEVMPCRIQEIKMDMECHVWFGSQKI